MKNKVFIGLGSNIGNKKKNIYDALNFLRNNENIKLTRISKFYISEPYGYAFQEKFLNCVAEIYTKYKPALLLQEFKRIEKKIGRKPTFKWGPRVIDIDILFYNDLILNTENLKIPHPDIQNRAFVLIPLADLEPDFIHPILNKTVHELIQELNIDQINSLKEEEFHYEILY